MRDIERSIAFYRDHFGLEVSEDHTVDGRLVWCCLRRGDAMLMLQRLEDDGFAPDCRSWVLYLSPRDIDAVHAGLERAGVEVSPLEPTAYGTVECLAKDPDGYELWISAPAEG